MTNAQLNSNLKKSIFRTPLEYLLLAICLCIIPLRIFFVEGVNLQLTGALIGFHNSTYSLLISSVLIMAFLLWLITRLRSSEFSYRFTKIEIGLLLFCAAAALAALAASNKRAAINNSVTILAPILMAVLLVQILNTKSKINLLLKLITILGAITTFYCIWQSFWLNTDLISQYQQDPDAILANFGIVPGSYQQMLFEHSLYSRDVRGFFITGNSAGSFALLSFFAALALMIEDLKKFKSNPDKLPTLLASGIIALLCLAGLVITKSKGAIAASIITAAILVIYLCFSKWITSHKKTVLAACLLLIVILAGLTVNYGLSHDRLPGGTSMLVRWQYWTASAKMFAGHPFTGVGGGNFDSYYPIYKAPAALETVSDPHNFLLSILTQFGPLGLAGFLAAVLVPLAAIILSYPKKTHAQNPTVAAGNLTAVIISFAVLGLLLHNCLDFAIFEPPIMTTLWALVAALIALDSRQKNLKPFVFKISSLIKIAAIALAIVITFSLFSFVLIPVAKAGANTKLAMQAFIPARTHEFLDSAAKFDRFNPKPLSMNGRLYLQHYEKTGRAESNLLNEAAQRFKDAISRDRADYRNYDKLSLTYILLADSSQPQDKTVYLNMAFENASLAVNYYPGSGKLRLKLAKAAEKLGKIDLAIENYKKAVEIEDAYRRQFKIMYPGTKVFSRLGGDNYNLALKKIRQLSTQPTP